MSVLENAATRMVAEFIAATAAGDFDRIADLHAPGSLVSDRRALMRVDYSGDRLLEEILDAAEWRRMQGDVHHQMGAETIATRGERLALIRSSWAASSALFGPSESDFLNITEVDEAGRRTAVVMLDLDDLDAADQELDARYAAGEGHRLGTVSAAAGDSISRLMSERDWEHAAAIVAPNIVLNDHRSVGLFTVKGRDVLVARWAGVFDAMTNACLRTDHIRTRGSGRVHGLDLGWQPRRRRARRTAGSRAATRRDRPHLPHRHL